MTAQVYQIRDYQSKRAIERAHRELERHMIEIANAAFPSVFDTAPSEYCAPEKDPA